MTRAEKLPTPRLQLRWAPSTIKHEYKWECHYELVILLGEYDIRREVYRNGNPLKKKLPRELAIPMKGPSLRGSSETPCTAMNGTRYADTPFRDGAHAKWDAIQIGCPPIFVIAPDGEAFAVEYDPQELRDAEAAA